MEYGWGVVFHGDLHFMRSLAPLEVEPLQLYGDVTYIEETASLSHHPSRQLTPGLKCVLHESFHYPSSSSFDEIT